MTPTPQGTQQVTGNEEESVLRQLISEELAKQTPNAQTVSTPAPSTIPVTLNGQTFNFNNSEDLSKSLQTLVDNYNTQIATAQTPQAPAKPILGNDDPVWDMATFVEKMTTDPREAMNYVDEHRLGVKNPSAALKDALKAKNDVDELKKVLSIYQFRDSHPDVSANPQAANVIAQILKSANLPENAQGLEAAYSIGVVRGMIPPPQNFQVPQHAQQPSPFMQQAPQMWSQHAQNNYNAPPPRLGRAAQDPIPDVMGQMEGMTSDQLLAMINKLQGQH